LVGGLLAYGGTAAMAQPAVKAMALAVTGEPGARVSGHCTLATPGGEETLPIDGPLPIERRLEGWSLRCDLTAEGQVVVEITRDGSRARSATRDGRVTLHVG
jgi:hypothetical protein